MRETTASDNTVAWIRLAVTKLRWKRSTQSVSSTEVEWKDIKRVEVKEKYLNPLNGEGVGEEGMKER